MEQGHWCVVRGERRFAHLPFFRSYHSLHHGATRLMCLSHICIDMASDPLEADSTADAVAVSGWTGDRAIAIGNEAKQEWMVFDGELADPVP